MANRLATATSPYLLQHAGNPVDWWPWSEEAFAEAMRAVRLGRLRTGAVQWGLFRDGEEPGRFVEAYLVPSWDEHWRQHTGRLTGVDREAEERALALADGPPRASHLLSAG